MFKKSVKTLLAVTLGLAFHNAMAATQTTSFTLKGSLSGSAVSVALDTNGDGIPSTLGTLQGKTNKGSVSVQYVNEIDLLKAAPSVNCLPDEIELPLVSGSSVTRLATGDLIYNKTTKQTTCLNQATGSYHFTNEVQVIGGTGQMTGVTGTGTGSGTGQILSMDTKSINSFQGITMTFESKVKAPK